MPGVSSMLPLLGLPYVARQQILAGMNTSELISLSHCSSTSKKIVRQLFPDSNQLCIVVADEVCSLEFRGSIKLYIDLRQLGEAPNQWIKHLMFIFNCNSGIEMYFYDRCEMFSVDTLHNALKDLQIHRLEIQSERIHRGYCAMVVERFLPAHALQLKVHPYGSNQELRERILKRSFFEELTFRFNVRVSGPTLMAINCRNLQIWKSEMSDLEVNILMRYWKMGRWNLKLNFMYMKLNKKNFLDKVYVPRMLKGLGSKLIRKERTFPKPFNYLETFKNGYDIQRKDGVKGTIQLVYSASEIVDLHFMVWH